MRAGATFNHLQPSGVGAGFPVMAQQTSQPFRDPALPMEKRIDNLLSQMTLDEKIDCLGTRRGVPRLGVPNFGSSEGIHGLQQRGGGRPERAAITTTQFPQPPGMGESWHPELVRQAGGVKGIRGAIYHANREVQSPGSLMLSAHSGRVPRPALGPKTKRSMAKIRSSTELWL